MDVKAHAEPTKDFFVRMITRDISLEDCILDLLDNSIDGAGRQVESGAAEYRSLEGYWAHIDLDSNEFQISDNCGGISLDNAINYAFRFGRRPDAPSDAEFGIGLYGIGMKRAIFKMGEDVEIVSKTQSDSFRVPINVSAWSESADWDFDLVDGPENSDIGTHITIKGLHPPIANEFRDSVFEQNLRKIFARDYSFIIQRGFEIKLNKKKINPYPFQLRESNDFRPVRRIYEDNGVSVEIIAGLAGLPPEDTSPDALERKDTDYFGWFVACNDRIVVAASKSDDSVWGDEGFTKWHPQYNGFFGIVRFRAEDPSLLPWTTTKREVDTQADVYRRAVVNMKEATRAFVDYSNARKENIDEAKAKERKAQLSEVLTLRAQESMGLPKVAVDRVKKANILYSVDRERVRAAGKVLGNASMAYTRIGRETFEYFYKNEVEE